MRLSTGKTRICDDPTMTTKVRLTMNSEELKRLTREP